MKYSYRAIALFLVISLALFSSCSGPEEKKMKFFERGKALYEKGDYVRARLEFKNALQVDPEFAQGFYMLGMAELKQKNWKKAFGLFSKATELDPGLLEAHVETGKLFLMAGRKKEAFEKAEWVLKKNPDNFRARLLKAACLTEDGKHREAEDLLKTLKEEDPGMPRPYLMLADLRTKAGDMEGAKRYLQELLGRDEGHRGARLLLAHVLEKNGEIRKAEKEYRRIMEQWNDQKEAGLLLAGFYERTKAIRKAEMVLKELVDDSPQTERFRLALARFYARNRNREAMKRVLEQTVKDLPERYAATGLLAYFYLEDNRDEKAVELLDRFMLRKKTGPDYLRAKCLKAMIRFREHKSDEALKLIDEILEENPRDIRAHRLRGDILLGLRDFTGAVAEYRAVVHDDPGNLPVLLRLARAHLLNRETGLAETTYRKILEINPEAKEARMGLYEVYRIKKRTDLAMEQLKEILAADPGDKRTIVLLGDMATASGDIPGAEKYWDMLLRLDPSSPVPPYKQGLVRLMEKKFDEGKALLEEALKRDPGFTPALHQLIKFYLHNRQSDKAIRRCMEQIGKCPENITYQVLLARLYTARGDLEKALAVYEKIRCKVPDNPRILMLIAATLDQMGKHKEAKDLYETVLDKKPDSMVAANNIAFYYAEYAPTKENLSKAERLIIPFLEKHPDTGNLLDTVAWVYYRQGKYEKARDLMARIPEREAGIPIFNYHLGMINLKMGKQERAGEYLSRALNGAGDFPGKEEARKALLALRNPD
ncbi:MAG: tetratricopeptide repeat protein [Deltaproteobacteria bacterium]|nr:tetratricopeptide repeat protein [Deltaproteobacteria bacterium]MBW2017954.1 tetratricopeptide repeat protein [Deltaproteobacteria bacterium]MBW2130588.1 tetratricopeptide repeat protein [Deltaproteobacteria bacterium]MBW2302957.1 tetratricopeptide repeat protein [Deltaproteobacteria bacterium]